MQAGPLLSYIHTIVYRALELRNASGVYHYTLNYVTIHRLVQLYNHVVRNN